ncbi:penicillin-binding transpeptidase domain-containing protein [Bacillus pinisoli]|uniref:penicillin-binding transpeptidase domain-containing protein n=1 Tax=Bacillus pinisoli TaxID=2901866 RepID=UPI001FF2C405|nr:penicillin-binding transpeptidase domain-containing protein [Bacillus pinisoli]
MRKWMILSVLVFFLVGCSENPRPEDRFAAYIALWNEQKFEEMYTKLSTDTRATYTEKDFSERYQLIYEAIGASSVQIQFTKPEEETDIDDLDEVQFPYSVTMETIAGPVDFEHEAVLVREETEEGEDWFIKWDSTHIFPQLKEGQEIKVASIEPVRGQIFDADGEPLAENGVVKEAGMVPGKLGAARDQIIQEVAGLLGLTVNEIEKALTQSWVKEDSFVPIKKVNPENQELINKLSELDGVTFMTNVESRYYPLGEAAAHLIGYIQNINADELKELKDKGYTQQSAIGRVGLEQVYESRLRGETGWKIYIPEGDVIAEKPAIKGEDIYITIQSDLQQKAFEQIQADAGTAIAINPKTGETLALVSAPSYDPNDFIFGMSVTQWTALNENPLKPLLARFNKTYSPGSTLKPITAAIGLESGTLDPILKMKITGKTWKKDTWVDKSITRVSDTLSDLNLNDALVTSDNIYFARTALELGNDNFTKGLQTFGFDEEIPFEFPTRTSTITNNGFTSEGLLADSGYGQGEIQMSPIHLASAYSAFVNEGNMIKPYLEKIIEQQPSFWKDQVMSPEHASLIHSSLVQVVENPLGTAHTPLVEGINIAGKTGTAELKASKDVEAQENGWFIAMNNDQPNLLIAMMIEHVKGRDGSHYVVPKVKQLFLP